MEEKNNVCGTCKYHCREEIDNGWICANDKSEYFTDWTEYNDTCEEWEGKE